jgi:hypothetical protein
VSAPYQDDPVYLTELPDDLRARRVETARRRRLRRRLVALAVLAVLGAIAAIAIVALLGSDGSIELHLGDGLDALVSRLEAVESEVASTG